MRRRRAHWSYAVNARVKYEAALEPIQKSAYVRNRILLILLQFQVWRQTGGLYYVTTINKCGVISHPMGAWEHILLKQTFETNFWNKLLKTKQIFQAVFRFVRLSIWEHDVT